MKTLSLILAVVGCFFIATSQAAPKKIILIAGPLDDHPADSHEYQKNVQLLKDCLDHAPNLSGLQTEVFLGWPTNAAALDDADTIFLTSGGSDRKETDHPLYVGDRFAQLEKQMNRGCGLVFFHWSTFHPARVQAKITEWIGGYFDYETGTNGPTGKWFSKIESKDWLATPATKTHPILNGINPFQLKEEFYYNLHFPKDDKRITPILLKDTTGNPQENTVAWAVERANGGRSFGFTGGHYYTNWWLYDFRKLVLNAIVWTAKMDVPADGVNSKISKNILALTSAKSPKKTKAPKKILPPTVPKDSGATAHEDAWVDGRWNQTDVGPFLTSALTLPDGTVAKGLSIRVGVSNEAAVVYDTATMNLRAAWTGGFLKYDPTRYGIINHPQIAGDIQILGVNEPRPGLEYRGLKLRGRQVVLSYKMNGADVFEMPSFENQLFSRVIVRAASEKNTIFPLVQAEHATNYSLNGLPIVEVVQNGKTLVACMMGDGALSEEGGKIIWMMPPSSKRSSVVALIASMPANDFVNKIWQTGSGIKDMDAKKKGVVDALLANEADHPSQTSSNHWPEIKVAGERAPDIEPYVVDTIPVPYDNAFKALMFITGVDFFDNGDAAVCTLHGDVWLVKGIDDSLQNVRWKRFATGLYQPLGLKIVNDQIYVLGRDQITRLHDEGKNGEADNYESFYHQIETSTGGHDFVTSLETDAQKNFYYVDPSGLHKISPDGKKAEIIAAGWRNPNGASISPEGIITVAPQEGEWTPASMICEVKPGGWYGYGGPRVTPERPLGYDPALVYLPRILDNSTGSQTWVTSDRWGPLQNQLLSFSFGRCSMMMVLRDVVDGQAQGAVVPMKPHFLSGAMRGAFRKQDGQLYVVGTLGWSTSATREGSFQRVRYTGKKVYSPISVHVRHDGIELGFTQPLDKETAEDPGSYGIEQWNYLYAATYGSKEYSVASPGTVGHDPVEIQSARLQPDGHTVFLAIASLQPVMQMQVKYNVNAADGKRLRGEIYNTINRLPAK